MSTVKSSSSVTAVWQRTGRMIARGFTLIELMIVIAIIAILATTAIPTYQNYAVKAKVAEALSVVSSLRLSVETTYLSGGSFLGGTGSPCTAFQATCNTAYGEPAAIVTKYVSSAFIGPNGVIEVSLNAAAVDSNMGTKNKLRFVPMLNQNTVGTDGTVTSFNTGTEASGTIAWKCVSEGTTITVNNSAGSAEQGFTNALEGKYVDAHCRDS